MNIRPLHDRIIVKRLEEARTSPGGIAIPDTAAEWPIHGKIIAVGKGKILFKGSAALLLTRLLSDQNPTDEDVLGLKALRARRIPARPGVRRRGRNPPIWPLPAAGPLAVSPEIEMTPIAAISGLGPEFDAFLFAVIGEDRNGMQLSVVSVLARVDLDPWQEAASLAALPAELAARRLAPLPAALPERTLQQTSATTMAVRLIALLPRRTSANTAPAIQESGPASAAHPGLLMPILIAVYLILSLGIQFLVARQDPPVRTNAVHVPASPTSQRGHQQRHRLNDIETTGRT